MRIVYFIRAAFWSKMMKISRFICDKTADRAVINHPNYVPWIGKLNSWAYIKMQNTNIRYRRAACPCKQCRELELIFK